MNGQDRWFGLTPLEGQRRGEWGAPDIYKSQGATLQDLVQQSGQASPMSPSPPGPAEAARAMQAIRETLDRQQPGQPAAFQPRPVALDPNDELGQELEELLGARDFKAADDFKRSMWECFTEVFGLAPNADQGLIPVLEPRSGQVFAAPAGSDLSKMYQLVPFAEQSGVWWDPSARQATYKLYAPINILEMHDGPERASRIIQLVTDQFSETSSTPILETPKAPPGASGTWVAPAPRSLSGEEFFALLEGAQQ